MTTRSSSKASSKRIAYIQAGWHKDIVEKCYVGMTESLASHDYDLNLIDRYEVPGSLEIPLCAKKLAKTYKHSKTDKYALIVAVGLIVDGGIYRHDFVANAVLQGIIQVYPVSPSWTV